MGYFSDKVHSVGKVAGQAGRMLEKGIAHGFKAVRGVVHTADRIGNTISRVASKANELSGGALDTITDAIPGAAAVKGAFRAGLNLTDRADKALSRVEGAVNRGLKRGRAVASRIGGVAQGAAKAADSLLGEGQKAAKRARKEGMSAARSIQQEVGGLRDAAVSSARAARASGGLRGLASSARRALSQAAQS